MLPDFDHRLRALAEIVVRVGLNLQPGQPLLITDPYELQGIHPDSDALAAAVRSAAAVQSAGSTPPAIEVVSSDPARLRALIADRDTRAFEQLVAAHIRRLNEHLRQGGAFLFLTGSAPALLQGLEPERLAEFDRIKWRHVGPLIQQLIRGATQWTLVPGPTSAWADVAYADLPAAQRLPALWQVMFEAFRVPTPEAPDNIESWRTHLAALAMRRDGYNAARHRQIRYIGTGTDLKLELPRQHAWCTAQQVTKRGLPFVANLPTEEVFTAPHRHSADGRVRVARPVVFAGSVIEGITLEFAQGRVIAANADSGGELLRQLLASDEGSGRIGEVAIVPNRNALSLAGRCFHHTIFDENAASHIALGESYRFCSRAWLPVSLNSSQIHVDLPLDARVELS